AANRLRVLARARRSLERELGRPPELAELAEATGEGEDRLRRLEMVAVRPLSFDAPVHGESSSELGELVSDVEGLRSDDALMRREERRRIRQLLEHLDVREQRIVCMRFGLD